MSDAVQPFPIHVPQLTSTIERTVSAVVPPKVEYRLTELGFTLGAAFCGVWVWAAESLSRVEQARSTFDVALSSVR